YDQGRHYDQPSSLIPGPSPVVRASWSVTVTGLRVVATHHQAFVKPHIMTVGGIAATRPAARGRAPRQGR
ncbi:MAG: hypothetical protein V2A73_17065, partial [Pseudomonadota bacterium]